MEKNIIFKILIIGIVLILCMIFLIIKKDNKFYINNKSFIKNDYNYKMEINYPIFNNRKVNKEIDKLVKNEQNKFLKKVVNNNNELNINYSYVIKGNVYSVHLRGYSYLGSNKDYDRFDKVYYFDKNSNKLLSIEDLVMNDMFYQVINKSVFKYFNNNLKLFSYDKLNDNKLILFGSDSVYVLIPPYYVNGYNKEVIVNISYREVKNYLNKNYFDNNNDDKMVLEEKVKKIRDKRQFKGKKLVALTFDDGPSYNNTEELLSKLEMYDARVSFFILGELAIKQPNLVKNIYNSGHTIGSHTYDHKSLTNLETEQLLYEINYTNKIIKNITGEDVKYLRPPYGNYNKEVLNVVNMSFILWNVDTEDWKLRNSKLVADYIIEHAKDGSIILLHDIHIESVNGAIEAIQELKNKGFAFVSIDEMIEYKGICLKKKTAYRYLK